MLNLFGVLIIFRKEYKEMATIYAQLIIKGKRKFSDVPPLLQPKVREVLVDLEVEFLIQEPTI